MKNHLALVGNPGVGKSTILNGIAKRAVFRSGVSIAKGLTYKLSQHKSGSEILYDTPGLEDVETRKQAGKELDALLSKKIPLRVAFVVKLQSGRVRQEDAAVIDLVLSAIQNVDLENKFAVVINMVTPGVSKLLKENTAEVKAMREGLTRKWRTIHWYEVAFDDSLEGADDKMCCPPGLKRFLDGLPVTRTVNAQTKAIDTRSYEEKVADFERYIRELETRAKQEREKIAQELGEQREKWQGSIAKQETMNKEGQKALEEIEKKLDDLNKRVAELRVATGRRLEELHEEERELMPRYLEYIKGHYPSRASRPWHWFLRDGSFSMDTVPMYLYEKDPPHKRYFLHSFKRIVRRQGLFYCADGETLDGARTWSGLEYRWDGKQFVTKSSSSWANSTASTSSFRGHGYTQAQHKADNPGYWLGYFWL